MSTIRRMKWWKFKKGMKVIKSNGNITEVEDIYFSGEFDSEIIQCKDGHSYINDRYCEIKPMLQV